jgi:hypothetical protein
MNRFLLNLTQISVSVKRTFFGAILLLSLVSVNGQNGIIGTGFGINNWSTIDDFSAGAGSSRIFTATPNAAGNQYFRLVRNWGSDFTQFGPSGCVDTDWTNPGSVYDMSDCGSGAFYINCPNTTDNYVFKTPNGNSSKNLLYFRVQGAVRGVSAVTQSPSGATVTECHSSTITSTIDGSLSAGQAVYLRYTKDNYLTSTVVKLTGSGTTYIGTIPSSFNTAGASVSYYVFTSGDTGVALDGSNADLNTINLNNNGGPNYSYSVVSGGAITNIPDDKFEQALIDLGLDCAKNGSVFTANISDVTFLDIRGKSITDLTGIEAFASLNFFYCGDNLLTSLDVSGLTNLWELVASNNSISSLDVHSSPHLYYLACDNNSLTSLNISGLTKLHVLDVSVNQLGGTLDVSDNPDLEYLYCNDNSLISLDVSGLTKILELVTSNNSISSLDVSASTDLYYLDCDKNKFTSINVTGLVKLVSFYCSDNELTSIDVRGLTVLKDFECTGNSGLKCIQVDDVAAANTKTITVGPDPDPDGKGPFLWAKDTGAIYSNCSLITTWTSALGGSWDNGVPTTGTSAAIIAADYNQPANIAACTLTVKNNATVYILSGFNVTLSSSLTVEAGSSFTLNNNANLVQTANVTNTGAIAVNLDSNALSRLDYTMWSSPVKAQNLLAFSPETIASRFYVYNPSTNLYGSITPGDHNFVPGFGYLIRMPNTAVSAPSTQIFEGVFTGEPNNGSLTFATTSGLYYAVGNPYPSTIDANAFLTGNSTDGTLYFWRKTNGEANTPGSSATGTAYATWTTMGSAASDVAPNNIAPDGTIALGQGFIVKSTGASLSFTNAMRTANNSAQFFKTKQLAGKSRVWLNLTNTTGAFSQALVGYVDGATVGVDSGIDGKYINDSAIALTSNINNEEYTIQGRPAFDASDIVALNFKTDVAGDYTVAIDHVDGLFASGQDVYLVDGKTGIETNLKEGSYTFNATVGVDNARFSLKYQKTLNVEAPVFNENSVVVYKNEGTLFVNSAAKSIQAVQVYDIQGRLIAEQNNVKANATSIKNIKASNQVLIVKISDENNTIVAKKVLN